VVARAFDAEIQWRMGWTDAELAAASPETVERLRWRAVAESLWSPDLNEAMYSPTPFGDAKAAIAAEKRRGAARAIHALLFPEGDTDGS
jgi:hypothetical protein